MKIINKFNEANIVHVYIKYNMYDIKMSYQFQNLFKKQLYLALLLHNSKANYTCHSRKSPYLNKKLFSADAEIISIYSRYLIHARKFPFHEARNFVRRTLFQETRLRRYRSQITIQKIRCRRSHRSPLPRGLSQERLGLSLESRD